MPAGCAQALATLTGFNAMEDIAVFGLILPFMAMGFVYMFVALLMSFGGSAFYGSPDWHDRGFMASSVRVQMPLIGVGATLVLFVLTGWAVFLLAIGMLSFWVGFRARQDLLRRTGGPVPWLGNALTRKWPMLYFDVGTLGIGAFCASLPFVFS